jgi:hypothetical protein
VQLQLATKPATNQSKGSEDKEIARVTQMNFEKQEIPTHWLVGSNASSARTHQPHHTNPSFSSTTKIIFSIHEHTMIIARRTSMMRALGVIFIAISHHAKGFMPSSISRATTVAPFLAPSSPLQFPSKGSSNTASPFHVGLLTSQRESSADSSAESGGGGFLNKLTSIIPPKNEREKLLPLVSRMRMDGWMALCPKK